MEELTLGDLKPFLELAKSGVLGFDITDVGAFFDKMESTLRAAGAWDAETEADLALAEQQLAAHPELFGEGQQHFIDTVDDLLARYPESTPLSQIPEFAGESDGDPDGELPPPPPPPEWSLELQIHVLEVMREGVTVSYDPATQTIHLDGAGIALDLADIDRIQFLDGTLAFDFDGAAGQAYRLYQAAFARTPDDDGLSWWIAAMDADTDLREAAAGFLHSDEFKEIYGTDPSNEELVAKLYLNILGREGEADGMQYWVDLLDAGGSRIDVLIGFSESPENIRGVTPAIENGIFFG